MRADTNHYISADSALALIKNEKPVTNAYVGGEINISGVNEWPTEIMLDNCIIEKLEGSVTQFKRPVSFVNCHFKVCQFVFSYFLQGLTIKRCTFESYLDFQAGGHNSVDFPVVIEDCVFDEFVNFFDCWFEGKVLVTNNIFRKGTNLESKKQMITFDAPTAICGNIGAVNLESEGNEDAQI